MKDVSVVSHRFTDWNGLTAYILQQMDYCTPGITSQDRSLVEIYVQGALRRMEPILGAVLSFEPLKFNHLNSLQYASFLYLLANEIWLSEGVNDTSDKLFLLNRSINSLDLFYKVKLPQIFVIAHGLGSVLVDTVYGENFIFFHHTTVGRLGEKVPIIGDNVILFPHSMILGNSTVGSNSVISAGTIVSNTKIPSDSIVFSNGNSLVIKPRKKKYIDLFLRQVSPINITIQP